MKDEQIKNKGINNLKLYLDDGVHPSEAPFLALLEKLTGYEFYDYEINDEGYIIRLDLFGSDEFYIGFFPEQICDLKFLQRLSLTNQNLKSIPMCIKNLIYLEKLDLSYNKLQKLPNFVNELTQLTDLYLADEDLNIPHRNVFDCWNVAELEENLSLKALSELFVELNKKEQTEREKLTKKFNEQKERSPVIYPPKEILNAFLIKPRNFEYIILWMLGNNFACGWSEFNSDPINISNAILSKYFNILTYMRYIFRVSKKYFMITKMGIKRLNKIIM